MAKQTKQEEVKQAEVKQSIFVDGAVLTLTFSGNKGVKGAAFKDGAFSAKVVSVGSNGYVVVEYTYSTVKMMGMDYKRANERGLLQVADNGEVKALTLMYGKGEQVIKAEEASAEHKAMWK